MANIFESTPIYTNVVDVRDTTTNTELQSSTNVSDWDVEILIWKAQDIIDDVIWDYWTPADENQNTIFPLYEETSIPVNIQKATILLVENLFVWWVLDWWAYELWWTKDIKSETSRWHTVSYYWNISWAIDSNQFLNDEIMIYLKPYLLNLSAVWYR